MDFYWEEANEDWDWDRLLQDLKKVKGIDLTWLQKTQLAAALCGVSIKEVCAKLNRKPNGMRVGLSRYLYRFIENLLRKRGFQEPDIENVSWQQIPRLLEQAGYKLELPTESRLVLESICSPLPDKDIVRAAKIIEAIEAQRLHLQLSQSKIYYSEEKARENEDTGDLAWKANNYAGAIDEYRKPVEKDPITYATFMVKLAMCYDKLYLYADSVEMSLAALRYVSTPDDESKLCGVLGSAFHELAIQNLDDLTLNLALDYYQKSIGRSEEPNVLGAWNSFDLISQFSIRKVAESSTYLRKAKLAFLEFQKLSRMPNSTFPTYRRMILEDAKRIQSELSEAWMCQELKTLQTEN